MPELLPVRDEDLATAAADLAASFHAATPLPMPPAPVRDLTFGQSRLLFLLRQEGPQPMGRIAKVFDLSSAAATGFVQRVERHGLVERRHRSDDRRVVECALTDDGRAFVEGVAGFRLEAIRRTLAVLDPDELADFHRLTRLILARHEARA